ncbi:MAG: hypothetical protein CVV47_14135 [Spirochaetae bacterium HGW-Spirochaetae-3]|jgi:16S rRNA G1207 methylase RsmC|nr:MAG: hypothetical protein CVV47_14135 [Spirochaetae bacterium HGW-Spirochaetae-3]
MNQFDIYVNKTVPFKFRGADMSFDLSHALFSSFDIDQGSRLLLKTVAKNVDAAAIGSIVDIGSGVGVLGIACAKGYPGATLRMRDRDALACAFSERNARRNRVAPVSVDRALFLDGIETERFDLALCNVPAKAGTPVLDRFLRDLPGILSDRGYGAVVVVEPIAEAALSSVKASGAEIVFSERGPGHSAIVFSRGAAAPADPGSLWTTVERSEQVLKAGKASYRLKGYWGLQEFDTPSFASELAMDMCENAMAGLMARRVAFINPGVGRVACHVQARARGATIDLCGRDALALAASARNVASGSSGPAGNSYPFASMLPDASYDLIVEMPDITPRVDTLEESWIHATRALKRGGSFVAAMPSSAMDRFERRRPKGWSRIAERKKKGFACAAWRLES